MKEVEDSEETEDEEIMTWDGGDDGEPKLGKQLSQDQREELNVLLKDYAEVFKTMPGKIF